MAKLLKLLGIVVGALIGLFVIALVGVSLVFDPNDYKPEISAAVEDATGRTLTLEGDLELNLFPRLRIALGDAELSDAAGFGPGPFVSIQGARLQVGLLPLLLSQRLEIDEARLDGLTLNLARNAQGQGNWESLGQATAADEGDAELIDDDEPIDTGEGGELTVAVQAIVIEDAEVNWSDATTGESWQLGEFNLELENFGPGVAFPMNTSFAVSGADIAVNLAADLAGDSLPLTVTGSLGAPSVRPDFGALVRAEVQEAVDERVEEEREELRDRLEDRLRGIFDR